MKLNVEQIYEVSKANVLLKDARGCLDNAMYRLGNINDEDLKTLREVYENICKAQDLL